MPKYIINMFIILALIFSAVPTVSGDDTSFAPWESGSRPVSMNTSHPSENCKDISPLSGAAVSCINFFSEYVSRVDGDRCPMYPTCASYGRQAVKKHGFFVGVVMTADRLIHEGNEMDYAPLVKTGGRIRYYDPVSGNDYWWYDGEENLDK